MEPTGVMEPPVPDVTHLVTEDDTPVDNFPSEKQRRLLPDCAYNGWAGPADGRPFIVAADVALYDSVHEPPVVPDVFLSLGVRVPDDWWEKGKRSYFFWEFSKAPDVVIEIVSNRIGGEATDKKTRYARMGIPYYVIYDPQKQIQDDVLRVYELSPQRVYVERSPDLLPGVGLGLTLWRGKYEDKEDLWLRWLDADGNLIPTGGERAAQAEALAEEERRRAEEERQQAEAERRRSERLIAQLRKLGVEPENGA